MLAKCIKKLGFTSGEIERVFETLDKELLISRVWVSILEISGAFGDRLKGLLDSPKIWKHRRSREEIAKSRYVSIFFQANFCVNVIGMLRSIG